MCTGGGGGGGGEFEGVQGAKPMGSGDARGRTTSQLVFNKINLQTFIGIPNVSGEFLSLSMEF